MQSGRDDPEMAEIAKLCEQDAVNLFLEVADQEKEWIEHLFKFGPIGTLTKKSLYDYVDYLTVSRMNSAGLPCPVIAPKRHPMSWIKKWLNSEAVQVAAQEVEISSYLISQIDMSVTPDFFKNVKNRFAEKRSSN